MRGQIINIFLKTRSAVYSQPTIYNLCIYLFIAHSCSYGICNRYIEWNMYCGTENVYVHIFNLNKKAFHPRWINPPPHEIFPQQTIELLHTNVSPLPCLKVKVTMMLHHHLCYPWWQGTSDWTQQKCTFTQIQNTSRLKLQLSYIQRYLIKYRILYFQDGCQKSKMATRHAHSHPPIYCTLSLQFRRTRSKLQPSQIPR